mmetsp:Transcript_13286/g.30244  ORF Transcript_13286/g.30244 Transcript_13286/m.30244 type:complete len:101 (-) Transcript_13286:1862-2164(-)
MRRQPRLPRNIRHHHPTQLRTLASSTTRKCYINHHKLLLTSEDGRLVWNNLQKLGNNKCERFSFYALFSDVLYRLSGATAMVKLKASLYAMTNIATTPAA